jgi:hypothetical protein
MDTLVDNLLTELRDGCLTRKEVNFDPNALKQLQTIVLRVDSRLSMTTAVWKAFQSKTDFERTSKLLIGLGAGVGFTIDNVSNLWVYALLGMFMTETEVMRQYLLQALADKPPFHRKDRKGRTRFIHLGTLKKEIANICSKYGARFGNEVDVELRNALAHETYWITQDTTVTPPTIHLRYCGDLGEVEKKKPFGEVIYRVRQQNILATIVAKQIQAKYDTLWFG